MRTTAHSMRFRVRCNNIASSHFLWVYILSKSGFVKMIFNLKQSIKELNSGARKRKNAASKVGESIFSRCGKEYG